MTVVVVRRGRGEQVFSSVSTPLVKVSELGTTEDVGVDCDTVDQESHDGVSP